MFKLGFFKVRFYEGLKYFAGGSGDQKDRVVPTANLRRKKEFFEEELLLMLMSLK